MIIIPGLPNDVALCILVRLPCALHGDLRLVSRPWRAALHPTQGPLHDLRRELNISEAYMLSLSHRDEQFHVLLIDLALRRCQEIVLPPPPGPIASYLNGLFDGLCWQTPFMALGSHIFMPAPFRNNKVRDLLWCLDASSMQWTRLSALHSFPSYTSNAIVGLSPICSSAMSEGYVYVAGGCDISNMDIKLLSQAERLDIKTKTWEVLPNMHVERAYFSAVMLHGCLYVFGGYPRVHSGEIWNPKSMQWTLIPELYPAQVFGEVKSAPHVAVVKETLYAMRLEEKERVQEIMYYEDISKSWISVGKFCFQETIERIFSVHGEIAYGVLGVGHELLVLCYYQRDNPVVDECSSPFFLVIFSTVPNCSEPISSWREWPLMCQVNPKFKPLIVHV